MINVLLIFQTNFGLPVSFFIKEKSSGNPVLILSQHKDLQCLSKRHMPRNGAMRLEGESQASPSPCCLSFHNTCLMQISISQASHSLLLCRRFQFSLHAMIAAKAL